MWGDAIPTTAVPTLSRRLGNPVGGLATPRDALAVQNQAEQNQASYLPCQKPTLS